MFIELRNVPRDYAWGAPGAITGLLGVDGACAPTAEGRPEAELWLGGHPGAPARVLTENGRPPARLIRLDQWIADHPERALGRHAAGLREGSGPALPFLMKVLAAAEPLSLQTHPDLAAAQAGFAREDAAGIPVDAPHRNYRDRLHKPELLLALSERFSALAGFRPVADSAAAVRTLAAAPFSRERDEDGNLVGPGFGPEQASLLVAFAEEIETRPLAGIVRRLLEGEPGPEGATAAALVEAVEVAARALGPDASPDARTALELAERYPGDPGVALALLMHRVELRAGEAIFLVAGTLHAYLRGVGIEVMAASDNVLRGGLTGKHIDVPELLATLEARPVPEPRALPRELAPGLLEFAPGVADFRVLVAESQDGEALDAAIALDGPAVALALEGEWELAGAASSTAIEAGRAMLATPEERELRLAGRGRIVIATTDAEGR